MNLQTNFKFQVMNRREAIRSGLLISGAMSVSGLKNLYGELGNLGKSPVMPVIFVGHGSPMNAIEENKYSSTWKEIGTTLPRPAAVLSVSAHWITNGVTKVNTGRKPQTIHDFGGFPKKLYEVQYPAPGSPEFADQTIQLLKNSHAEPDTDWGLDHGTWSVLVNMYPKADIPVFQLSIDYSKPPEYHYNLMNDLRELRNRGVLIMGSGNMVHNLSMLSWEGKPFDWCIEFDSLISGYIDKGDFQSVVRFRDTGNLAKLAHPSYDHFLPLIYTLGVADAKDRIHYFNEGFDLGSISMRSLLFSKENQ